jgi:UDP-N-acetylglucosamine 4,6-dehydratase/5-epimerase
MQDETLKIFLTGGTGSLGKALLRFFSEQADADVTVYSRDEVKQGELRHAHPDVRFMLGDVRDYDRLLLAMREQQIVIHAAAYKQVPSAEANVDEAIATNVLGSLNVARAAVHNEVSFVVGVSTDKACQPINAYGETKALMEKLFQQADDWSDTAFNCVRYGNVLGSRGSVVPLFRNQLRRGDAITVTDPHMTRFWMTLRQAVNLVWAATGDGIENGAVLVPRAPASSMMTLVLAINRLWGDAPALTTDAVQIIGVRPGEKTHEQLIHANESLHTLPPQESLPYYQIMPAAHPPTAAVHAPFEYRSDTAYQLSVDELAAMLAEDADE